MFHPIFKMFQKLLHPSDFLAHLLTINFCVSFSVSGLLHKFPMERRHFMLDYLKTHGPEEFADYN